MARTLPPLLTGEEKLAGPASEPTLLGPEYIGSLGPRFAVLGTKVRAIQADEPPDLKLPPTGGIPKDRLFGVDFDNEPHGAIMGKSGAGKSNTTGVFVMNLVALKAQVYVAEPVESGDYSRFGDRISRATTPQGISDMLDFLCDEITRRRRLKWPPTRIRRRAGWVSPSTKTFRGTTGCCGGSSKRSPPSSAKRPCSAPSTGVSSFAAGSAS